MTIGEKFSLFGFAILAIVVFFVGKISNLAGHSAGYREATEKRLEDIKERCCPTATRPCVFGPGIVGIQRCIYTTWDKCEPDPRFRVPQPGASAR